MNQALQHALIHQKIPILSLFICHRKELTNIISTQWTKHIEQPHRSSLACYISISLSSIDSHILNNINLQLINLPGQGLTLKLSSECGTWNHDKTNYALTTESVLYFKIYVFALFWNESTKTRQLRICIQLVCYIFLNFF